MKTPSNHFSILLLGNTGFHLNKNIYLNKYLLGVLISAGKKAPTRHWLQPDPPTMEEWQEIVNNIYLIEKNHIHTQDTDIS